jgi:hypothetical protein
MTYDPGVRWEIEYTDEFERWWHQLSEDDQERVQAAMEILEVAGPALGRPLVDTLKGSRPSNLKELRPRGGHLRVLFAFDPRRVALLLLLGGDKSGQWSAWYAEAIPAAEERYEEHLVQLREEGELTN